MVVVTGANGFVARAVSEVVRQRGERAVGLVRQAGKGAGFEREWVHDRADFDGIESAWPDWARADAVIHLAARVHVMHDAATDPLAAYRQTNVEGTMRVARAAHAAGVRRFVYVSSIKAVAESSTGRSPLTERDEPAPPDFYGISKLEAERALQAFARDSGLEVVIVRPPLVYGPGVRANFLSLMHALSRGMPLPLGAISARRSLVFVHNLADVLATCAYDPRAAGHIFHVADAHDLTVTELARELAAGLGVRARLIPVPAAWLRFAGRMSGRLPQVERLIGSLQLDTRHVRDVLGWHPPHDIQEGLTQTASWYRSTR